MAKTIIKGGKNEFLGHCKWCGCDFRYTAEDVTTSEPIMAAVSLSVTATVSCPFCSRILGHLGEHGTGRATPMNYQDIAWQQAAMYKGK